MTEFKAKHLALTVTGIVTWCVYLASRDLDSVFFMAVILYSSLTLLFYNICGTAHKNK